MDFRTVLVFCITCISGVLPQDISPTQYCRTTWNTFGKAIIDVDDVTDFDVVRSVTAYFCQRKPIKFQIWRPLGSLYFELLWEYSLLPPAVVPGIKTEVLPTSFHFPTEQIYRVGFAPADDGSFPIGLNFFPNNQGSVMVSAEDTLTEPLRIGQPYNFVDLLYPYKFAGSACNDTENCELPDISVTGRPLLNETDGDNGIPSFNGSIGLPGPPGPMGLPGPVGQIGAQGIIGISGSPGPMGGVGPVGEDGLKGKTGDKGDSGSTGEEGLPGLVGLPGLTERDNPNLLPAASPCECRGFSDPNLILGMLVWALILTLLLIIMLVLATKRPTIVS